MSEEQRQKEAEVVQEFKLEQDNELRFEVESKEKVTLEVWYITQFFSCFTYLIRCSSKCSLNLDLQKYLEQNL